MASLKKALNLAKYVMEMFAAYLDCLMLNLSFSKGIVY